MGYSSDRDDHTAFDHEGFSESGESDESGSGSVRDLLDLEALESGEECDDDGRSTESHDGYHVSFPQFCRLPIELRHRVWELFDPDLKAPVRIFEVENVGAQLWPSATLIQQSQPARTILEVHRESRQLALKFYPDKLPIMKRNGWLRYHKARDIISLNCWAVGCLDWAPETWGATAGNLEDVEHLALKIGPQQQDQFQLLPFHLFKNLKTAYACWEADELRSRNLKWCVSDAVRTFYVKTEEEDIGVGEDYEMIYCWPDLENHPDYVEKEVPQGLRLGRFAIKGEGPGIEFCPMVVFSSIHDIQLYYHLRKRGQVDGNTEWDSDSDSESDSDTSEEDEYESEGIDDATLDGSDDADGDDDDLVVHDAFEESDDENDSEISGFSRQNYGVVPDDDDELAARFSSLEPNSPRHRNSDHSDSDDQPVRQNARTKRRVVSSDSEDESADEPPRKVAKRSRHGSRRPGRAVLSDSDEEDTDEHDAKSGDRGSSDSDASPSEDSEEESDKEQGSRKPMSLRETLRLFLADTPVTGDGTDSDSDETSTQNSYEEAEDDDGLVERGVFRNGDEFSENDLIMDITEEGSASDDDGW
ncbi:hypothetical protein DL771_008928 [Monosporascus sp. 5C6A]|nr:hypothetical protein DL771_008928 [Monosporascus sp. 5C6A]